MWRYTNPSGGGLEKAVDFLALYGTDSSATWPYPDLEGVDPMALFVPLRLAANALQSQVYEHMACSLIGMTPEKYLQQAANLVMPAQFPCNASLSLL